MKKFKAFAAMAAMILMVITMAACNGSGGGSGHSGTPLPAQPNDQQVTVQVRLPWADNPALAASNLDDCVSPDDPLANLQINGEYVNNVCDETYFKPAAITPAPAPNLVYIFGGAINMAGCKTHSPWETNASGTPVCLKDVSSSCPGGVCNISLMVPPASWDDMALYYGGEVHPESMSIIIPGGATVALDHFINLTNGTTVTDPNYRAYVTACYRIDIPASGPPVASTNNPRCTFLQTDLLVPEIVINGVSDTDTVDFNHPRQPFDGTTAHDGVFLIKGSLLPDTLINNTFPRILPGTLAGGTVAYTHVLGPVTASTGGTLAVYIPDLIMHPTAPSGDIAPDFAVHIRTRRVGSATILCNWNVPASELIHFVTYGTITQGGSGLVVPMRYYQLTGWSSTTGCPIQPAPDNRLQNITGT